VYPDKERAQRLARTLVAASPLDYFEISDGVSLVEIGAPKSLIGKNAISANLRKTHGVTVLAIKRPARGQSKPRFIVDAVSNETVEKGDRLVVFGPDDKLGDLS
jgi:trk system potassium uptake protein TrkA